MKTINIAWLMSDGRGQGQDDPAWYVSGDGHSLVCSVSDNEREIQIYCDGEMRVIIGDDFIADESGWAKHGIHTDADIVQAFDDGRLEWVNNAWFDLYDTSGLIAGEHLDCVSHSLTDAIEHATALLEEVGAQ